MQKKVFVLFVLIMDFVLVGGLAAQSGTGWPDNECMRQVPKPPFNYGQTEVDRPSYFSVSITGATAANFRSYKQTLKNRGFVTVVEDTEDNSKGFHYKASNAAGWLLEMSFYPRSPNGQGGFTISKTGGSSSAGTTPSSQGTTTLGRGQLAIQNLPGRVDISVWRYSGAIGNESQATTAEDAPLIASASGTQQPFTLGGTNGLPINENGTFAVKIMEKENYEEHFFSAVRFTNGAATVDWNKPNFIRKE
jgi:hypothetical protein